MKTSGGKKALLQNCNQVLYIMYEYKTSGHIGKCASYNVVELLKHR